MRLAECSLRLMDAAAIAFARSRFAIWHLAYSKRQTRFCYLTIFHETTWFMRRINSETAEMWSTAAGAVPPGVYTIMQSADLASWTILGAATNSLGSVSFVDATAHLSPRKFYSVRVNF